MPADETPSQAKRRKDGCVFLALLISQAALPSGAPCCLCALRSWHGLGADETTNTVGYLSPSLEPAGARADHGGAGSCLLGPNPRAGRSCNRAAGGEGEEELHGPALLRHRVSCRVCYTGGANGETGGLQLL